MSDGRLPMLDAAGIAAAIDALPARSPIAPARRAAPPSLRPTRLDPLQVDVFAAIIATLPAPCEIIPFPQERADG